MGKQVVTVLGGGTMNTQRIALFICDFSYNDAGFPVVYELQPVVHFSPYAAYLNWTDAQQKSWREVNAYDFHSMLGYTSPNVPNSREKNALQFWRMMDLDPKGLYYLFHHDMLCNKVKQRLWLQNQSAPIANLSPRFVVLNHDDSLETSQAKLHHLHSNSHGKSFVLKLPEQASGQGNVFFPGNTSFAQFEATISSLLSKSDAVKTVSKYGFSRIIKTSVWRSCNQVLIEECVNDSHMHFPSSITTNLTLRVAILYSPDNSTTRVVPVTAYQHQHNVSPEAHFDSHRASKRIDWITNKEYNQTPQGHLLGATPARSPDQLLLNINKTNTLLATTAQSLVQSFSEGAVFHPIKAALAI